jgi:hypothetical protein
LNDVMTIVIISVYARIEARAGHSRTKFSSIRDQINM